MHCHRMIMPMHHAMAVMRHECHLWPQVCLYNGPDPAWQEWPSCGQSERGPTHRMITFVTMFFRALPGILAEASTEGGCSAP